MVSRLCSAQLDVAKKRHDQASHLQLISTNYVGTNPYAVSSSDSAFLDVATYISFCSCVVFPTNTVLGPSGTRCQHYDHQHAQRIRSASFEYHRPGRRSYRVRRCGYIQQYPDRRRWSTHTYCEAAFRHESTLQQWSNQPSPSIRHSAHTPGHLHQRLSLSNHFRPSRLLFMTTNSKQCSQLSIWHKQAIHKTSSRTSLEEYQYIHHLRIVYLHTLGNSPCTTAQ